MKRVFYEKIGQYLGREFRILKLDHGRRHYRISGQGSADNFVPGPIPEKPPWGLPSTVQCSRTKSRISPRSPDWGCPLSPISGSLASSTRGMGKIGIRREDALIYERRCPLIPSHVGELVKQGWGCVQLGMCIKWSKQFGPKCRLKNIWDHKCLPNKGHEVIVEPASKRAFSDIEFEKEGATINSDLSRCDVILGVKQIPIESLVDNSTSVFFSHTIKVNGVNSDCDQSWVDPKPLLRGRLTDTVST